MHYLVLSFGLCWGMFWNAPQHDFHTSIADINYNSRSKTFEVSLRVFWDDLETALNQAILREEYAQYILAFFSEKSVEKVASGNKVVEIDESDKYHDFITLYLQDKFYFIQKEKKILPIFIGKETDMAADVVWLYLEFPMKNIEGAEVRNTIFMEIFQDQVNILNFNYMEKKRTFLCKAGDLTHSLSF